MRHDPRKRGVVLSYIVIILQVVTGLLISPLLIRGLGEDGFGLYQLIGSFVGSFTVLDFGLSVTVTRYVARYRAAGDVEGQARFLFTVQIIYAALTLLCVGLGLIARTNLWRIFGASLTAAQLTEAAGMMNILIANLALSLLFGAFSAVLEGYERFVFLRVLQIGRMLIRLPLIALLMTAGSGAVSVVMFDTALNAAMFLFHMVWAVARAGVRLRPSRPDPVLIRDLFGYSFFIFVGIVVDQLYWRIDQLILGIVSIPAVVGISSLGSQIALYYIGLSSAIAGVFLPTVTRVTMARPSGRELTDLMIRVGRLQLLVLGFVLGGFAVLGAPFIRLWVGTAYGDVYLITLILLIPLTVPLVQTIGLATLRAMNKHAFRSVVYLGVALLNVGVTLALARFWGAVGAAAGTSLALIVGNIVIMNIYYHRAIGFEIPRFARETAHRLLPAQLAAVAVSLLFHIPGRTLTPSWPLLAAEGVLYTLLYVVLVWRFGLNAGEKELLLGPLGKFLKRNADKSSH